MKKVLKRAFLICLSFIMLMPTTAFAAVGGEEAAPEWQDVELSQEEFDRILANNPNNAVTPYTSGLICGYSIGIDRSGSTLTIVGRTIGSPSVVKAGFKKIVIQRKKSGGTWSDYKTYSDLYNNRSSYVLSKTITISSGYYYRVTCIHYAKKNIFSTEKINNTSNTIKY